MFKLFLNIVYLFLICSSFVSGQKSMYVEYLKQMNTFLAGQKNMEIEMAISYFEKNGNVKHESVLYKKLGENVWMKQGQNLTIINNKYFLQINNEHKIMFIVYPRKKIIEFDNPVKMQFDSIAVQIDSILSNNINSEGNIELQISSPKPEIEKINVQINSNTNLIIKSEIIFNSYVSNTLPYKKIEIKYLKYDFKKKHPKDIFLISSYLIHDKSGFTQTNKFKNYTLYEIKQ